MLLALQCRAGSRKWRVSNTGCFWVQNKKNQLPLRQTVCSDKATRRQITPPAPPPPLHVDMSALIEEEAAGQQPAAKGMLKNTSSGRLGCLQNGTANLPPPLKTLAPRQKKLLPSTLTTPHFLYFPATLPRRKCYPRRLCFLLAQSAIKFLEAVAARQQRGYHCLIGKYCCAEHLRSCINETRIHAGMLHTSERPQCALSCLSLNQVRRNTAS